MLFSTLASLDDENGKYYEGEAMVEKNCNIPKKEETPVSSIVPAKELFDRGRLLYEAADYSRIERTALFGYYWQLLQEIHTYISFHETCHSPDRKIETHAVSPC